MNILILLPAFVAVLPAISSCPLSCNCEFLSNKATCRSINNLESIAKDVPPGTQILTMEQSSFSKIKQSDFSQLPTKQIKTLTITQGFLDEISVSAFAEIAPSLRILNLRDNRIRAIEIGAFKGLQNLQELDLSRNRLSYFTQDIFKPLVSLKMLNLGYNKYTNNFPNNVFSAQNNLQTLAIDGNNLSSLKSSMFKGLQNLQSLYASNCMISSIDNEVFVHIHLVTNLDISYNQLHTLPSAESLRSLRNLRNLTLLGNSLTVIGQNQFQGLNIDTLDLTRNQINQLHPDAFSGMGSVRYLHLSENNLVSLPETVFQPIGAQLFSLKLNGNRGLSLLPENIFNDLQAIRDLNMSFCGLKKLENQHFAQVYTLQQLDLSDNRLEFLPAKLFERANMMNQLKVKNNPWHCSCLIKPFRDWLQLSRSSTIMGCNMNSMASFNGNSCRKPTCSTPTSLMYRDIAMLTDDVLSESCEKLSPLKKSVQVEVIVGIVAGIVLIIIIIIVCVCCLYRRHKHGEPLLCTDTTETTEHKKIKPKPKKKKEHNRNEYFEEKKEKRRIDADNSSLNESDKSFVVRNFFHSMVPNPDAESQGTQSMTRSRKDSIESLSQYEYGSRHGSRHSSQYSLNTAYRIESAV